MDRSTRRITADPLGGREEGAAESRGFCTISAVVARPGPSAKWIPCPNCIPSYNGESSRAQSNSETSRPCHCAQAALQATAPRLSNRINPVKSPNHAVPGGKVMPDPMTKKVLRLLQPDQPVDVRCAAALILGEDGTKEAELTRALCDCLKDGEPRLRVQVIKSVGKLRIEAALPQLLERIKEGGEEAEQAAQ